MNTLIETANIDTKAGTYTLEYHADDNAEQPFNDGFTIVTDGGRNYIDIREGDTDSDPARTVIDAITTNANSDNHWYWELRSGAAIVRYLKLKGYNGVQLVQPGAYYAVTPTADRGGVYGVAWAPDDATDPDAYTLANLKDWRSWANGEVYGWRLLDPAGDEVQSVWGYYGDGEWDYMRQEATGYAEYDADERVKKANLVGAGFVGIV